jgi:hypothetical protein
MRRGRTTVWTRCRRSTRRGATGSFQRHKADPQVALVIEASKASEIIAWLCGIGIEEDIERCDLLITNDDHIPARIVGCFAARARTPSQTTGVVESLRLTDWRLPEGGLYFVTPTARARPAKVSALADFFISKLTAAEWSAETFMDWKSSSHRRR